jgi:membrane-associated protease RseP (regulator of RpoE activity)
MGRQTPKVAGITLTVLAAVAVAAAAQDRPARPAEPPGQPEPPQQQYDRQRAFTWSLAPGEFNFQLQRRGRLGILVDLTPDPARDSVGARVAGVTPGGPADRADVRTGDLIVRINGTRLAALPSRSEARPGRHRAPRAAA